MLSSFKSADEYISRDEASSIIVRVKRDRKTTTFIFTFEELNAYTALVLLVCDTTAVCHDRHCRSAVEYI